MTDKVLPRIVALRAMPIEKLKQTWRDLYQTEPPAYNRRHLENRLAYRIQELAYGGLKPTTVKRLEELGEPMYCKAWKPNHLKYQHTFRVACYQGAFLLFPLQTNGRHRQ